MSGGPPIEIPGPFFELARWLNPETLKLGPQGMVEKAAKGSLAAAERLTCRAFIDEVLRRVTDDHKLRDLLIRSGARLHIEKPEGARYLLNLMREALSG